MKHIDLDYYNEILWTDGYKALKEKAYEEPYNIFTIQQVTPLHVEDIREFWEWLQHAQLHNEYFPIEFLREVQDTIKWEVMPNELEFTFEEMKEFKDKINWPAVIYRQLLTEEELDWYLDVVAPDRLYDDAFIAPLITHQHLTDYILEKYWHIFEPHMKWLCMHQQLSREFIRKHKDTVDWYQISSSHMIFDDDFYEEFYNYIDWEALHQNRELDKQLVMRIYSDFNTNARYNKVGDKRFTQSFISRYYDTFKWDWQLISIYVPMTCLFILANKEKLNMKLVAQYQQNIDELFVEANIPEYVTEYIFGHDVSIDFIRKHADDIYPEYWGDLISRKHFDEELMREFIDYIDWHITFTDYKWDFARENVDRISWTSKLAHTNNQNVTMKQIEELGDKIDWDVIGDRVKLEPEFCEKWAEKFSWQRLIMHQHFDSKFILKNQERMKVYKVERI